MTSDSFRFDLTDVPIKPAMQIAFAGNKATHWKHDKENNRILLAWHESTGKDFVPFLTPVTAVHAEFLVNNWLDVLDYGSQPDHDGDNDKSFRIYNESWGFVGNNHYVFAAIAPAWAMYGK